MRLLLLSRYLGAVPEFLDTPRPEDRARTWIAYVDDAALPFGDAGFVLDERAQLADLGYDLSDVTVGEMSPTEAQSLFSRVDAVYLAGGSADVLMNALRTTGIDRILVDKVQQGMPLLAGGAGSVCAGMTIESDLLMDGQTDGLEDDPIEGLGLVDTLIVTHADGQLPPYPKALIDDVVRSLGDENSVTLISDDQALLVDGDRVEIVDSQPSFGDSSDPELD